MALTPQGPGGTGADGTGIEGTGNAGTADAGWLRVHPASPFVRGWVALAALLFFFGRDTFERLLQGGPVFDERFTGRAPWLLLGGGTVSTVCSGASTAGDSGCPGSGSKPAARARIVARNCRASSARR